MVMVKRETVVQKPMRLGDFIREFKRWIMVDWEREVRRHPFSLGVSEPRLLGHLPDLLEWVACRVEAVHTGGHPAPKEPRAGHPLALLATGQDLEEVVHEYALLRACILRLYEAHAEKRGGGELAVTLREVRRFDETLDEAVLTATSRCARTHARIPDPLAEVALEPEDLELLLPELRACLPGQEHAQKRLLDAILALKREHAEVHRCRTARAIMPFLSFLEHNLRNLLHFISTNARMMERLECGVASHANVVSLILVATSLTDKMRSILLDLLRERFHGGIAITPEATQLQVLWGEAVKELEGRYRESRVRLSTQGDLQGEWDPRRVVQLLGILCENALVHSLEDSIVDCALRDEGDTVCMELHHKGPTIPAESLSRCFTSYDGSADPERALVPVIVRAHGGTLAVRSSDAEGGTTVTVKLPRYGSKKQRTDAAPAGEGR